MAGDGGGEALRVEHVAKRFGGVTALRDVNLHLGKGEVLGLIGDNGAGKSTLIKILCGFHQPDAGKLFVGGEEVVLKSVDHARTLGIDTVYQDLALVNELSVYHNMFLNRELVRWPPERCSTAVRTDGISVPMPLSACSVSACIARSRRNLKPARLRVSSRPMKKFATVSTFGQSDRS